MNGADKEEQYTSVYARRSEVDNIADSLRENINELNKTIHAINTACALINSNLDNFAEKVTEKFETQDSKLNAVNTALKELMTAHMKRQWFKEVFFKAPRFFAVLLFITICIGIAVGSGAYKDGLKYLTNIEKIRNGTYASRR